MNFQDCFKILEQRSKKLQENGKEESNDEKDSVAEDFCQCQSDPNRPTIDFCQVCQPEHYKIDASLDTTLISEISFDRFLDLIFQVQVKRRQAYGKYNETLDNLLQSGNIQEYPNLCTHMTLIFNQLSQSVLAIKGETLKRIDKSQKEGEIFPLLGSLKSFVSLLEQLQNFEKEKLLLIASVHLHKMQEHLPDVRFVTGGKSHIHEDYYKRQQSELEARVNEVLENLQALKIDLLDM